MLKQHFSSSCDTVAVRALHFLRVPIFDEVSDQGPAIKTGDVAMFIATKKKANITLIYSVGFYLFFRNTIF
jgi:hypothetical protein